MFLPWRWAGDGRFCGDFPPICATGTDLPAFLLYSKTKKIEAHLLSSLKTWQLCSRKVTRFSWYPPIDTNVTPHGTLVGWFERTFVFSGIQFTKHLIESFLVETIEVVRSNSNVILTRQNCGQRSSRIVESKCRAVLVFYFPVRIWLLFSISMCRGESDLGLCMTSVLAKRMRPHSADFRFKNVFGRRIRWKSALRSRNLFASTEVMQRPWSDFPLHFDIEHIYQIRIEK